MYVKLTDSASKRHLRTDMTIGKRDGRAIKSLVSVIMSNIENLPEKLQPNKE